MLLLTNLAILGEPTTFSLVNLELMGTINHKKANMLAPPQIRLTKSQLIRQTLWKLLWRTWSWILLWKVARLSLHNYAQAPQFPAEGLQPPPPQQFPLLPLHRHVEVVWQQPNCIQQVMYSGLPIAVTSWLV
jgi:hypothetical protein